MNAIVDKNVFPVSEGIADAIISLPRHLYLEWEEHDYIIESIHSIAHWWIEAP